MFTIRSDLRRRLIGVLAHVTLVSAYRPIGATGVAAHGNWISVRIVLSAQAFLLHANLSYRRIGSPAQELSAEAAEGADDPDVPEANVGGDAESKSSNAGIKEDDKAKEAYRTGDYAAAVKAWTRSLSSVKYLLEKDLYKHNPAQEKEVEGMELRLCLNLAQVHLKLSEWGQAVTFADKALVRDARNAKALYRKASALMELMSYSEAIEVLGRLLEFEPSNSAAVAMLAKANRSASLSEVRERRQAKKIFAGIERDSRVPPTEWEVFVDSVREAVADCFGQLEGKLGVRCPCRRSRSRAPGVDGDKKD
ncbi:unnamed protein product [Polarella glacialis]|uniref:peptidylprolyl isomerase n=1 Tax=Polarella glacialis TaxID=89957 RepID=A0A813LTE6_POLGL|nr:unnamed protein product [Polarella glacialis]